jgi:hypothetical protein
MASDLPCALGCVEQAGRPTQAYGGFLRRRQGYSDRSRRIPSSTRWPWIPAALAPLTFPATRARLRSFRSYITSASAGSPRDRASRSLAARQEAMRTGRGQSVLGGRCARQRRRRRGPVHATAGRHRTRGARRAAASTRDRFLWRAPGALFALAERSPRARSSRRSRPDRRRSSAPRSRPVGVDLEIGRGVRDRIRCCPWRRRRLPHVEAASEHGGAAAESAVDEVDAGVLVDGHALFEAALGERRVLLAEQASAFTQAPSVRFDGRIDNCPLSLSGSMHTP